MKAELLVVGDDIAVEELTWKQCHRCEKELAPGDSVWILIYLSTPWLAEDDEDNEYVPFIWHEACDGGSLAAAGVDVSL